MRTPRSVTFVSSAVVLSLALLLGACGDDGDDSATAGDSSTTTAAATATPPDGLVTNGKLTACSDTPYEPFEFEGTDGQQTGYDIDLLRDIAGDAGLQLDVKDLPFDGILGSLAAGDCDVVASAVTITDERKQQVDFSSPYFDADQSLLVNAGDDGKYAKLEDLTGQRIGVQSGTTGETYANEHKPSGATIVSFEDADAMFAAMTAKDVVALLQDFPVNAYRAQKDDAFTVTEKFPTGEQYGYAIAKGKTAIVTFVDDGLSRLHDDGRFDAVFSKYFGESK
jgi:polar amino acid transport system substrate-binding protein